MDVNTWTEEFLKLSFILKLAVIVSLMVINALKSTKYKVEKVGVWYICASTFISGLKIFYLVESKKLQSMAKLKKQ